MLNKWVAHHFKPSEYRCKCGCGLEPTAEMLEMADTIREWCGVPITITSGARCKTYNSILRQRGYRVARFSAHLEGLALDLATHDMELFRQQIAELAPLAGFWFERFDFTPGWCHVQIREISGKGYGPFTPFS